MTIINPNLTFDKRDDFNRRPIAEKLIHLLKSEVIISPMVIDGNWGSGKTEFTNKLVNLFNENAEGFKIIYIDAFQIDHADEPLISILAQILNLLPEDRSGVIKKAIPAIRFGLKTTLKAGVGWVLRQDSTDVVDDFDKDIKDACDQAINASIESLIRDHQEVDQSILVLKNALAEVTKNNQIIIFVDELDRCRPDFAIKLLEKIKHIFDVPKIQFVLVANKDQLRSAIKHRYGPSIDSQKYLDKFLSFSFSLPHSRASKNEDLNQYSVQHYFDLIGTSAILNETQLMEMNHLEFIETLFKVNDISLREAETLVQNMEIFQTLTNKFDHCSIGSCLLMILGVFIFCFSPSIRKEVEHLVFDAKKINSLLGVGEYIHDGTNSRMGRIKTISTLIFIESNVNTLDTHEKMGLSEDGFQNIKDSINDYFDPIYSYSLKGRTKIIMDTIYSLKLV